MLRMRYDLFRARWLHRRMGRLLKRQPFNERDRARYNASALEWNALRRRHRQFLFSTFVDRRQSHYSMRQHRRGAA